MPLKILTLLGMMGVGAAVDKMGNGCDDYCADGSWQTARDCELREAVDGYVGTATEKSAVVAKYGEMEDWDMSEVTCLDQAFKAGGASDGIRTLVEDLSRWDVSAATSMSRLFNQANAFTSDLSKWNTGKVTDMARTFDGANAFNGDVSSWDTGKVTDMVKMFHNAYKFNYPINTWDTSKVTDMSEMFRSAWEFDQDVSYLDTSQVEDISNMFELALAFNQPLDNFGPFAGSITDSKLKIFIDSPCNYCSRKIVDGTWAGHSSMPTNPTMAYLQGTDRCEQEPSLVNNIVTWSTKGDNCPARAAAPAPAVGVGAEPCVVGSTCDKVEIPNPNPHSEDFYWFMQDIAKVWCEGTYKTSQNISPTQAMIDAKKVITDKYGPIENWDMSEMTTLRGAFSHNACGNTYANFNLDISEWDTSSVTTMHSVFSGCGKFNQDLSKWDTTSVTSMRRMFYKAYTFDKDLNNWDTSNVDSMQEMFSHAFSFNNGEQPLHWDTSAVESMSFMFYKAYSFNQDISWLDTSELTTIDNMLFDAVSFNRPLNEWDVSTVTTKTPFNWQTLTPTQDTESSDIFTWPTNNKMTYFDKCMASTVKVDDKYDWQTISTTDGDCPDRAAAPPPVGNLKYLQCDDLEEAYAAHCDCNIHGQDISTTSDLLTKIKSGLDFSCPY